VTGSTVDDTVIIGAGGSGLACARELHDSGRSFRLIAEDVGGRIRSSVDGTANMGAYYVTRDYVHVNRWVDRGRRIRRRQIQRGSPDGSFRRGDLPLLAHLPQAVRFVLLVRDFQRRYEALRLNCLVMSQAEAIRADPKLWDLYREPAVEFVRRHRIEDVARIHIAPLAQATAFVSMDRITALTLLIGVLPTVVPIYEFTFRPDDLMRGFEEALVLDSVTEVSRETSHYSIRTSSGETYFANNVVVATPIEVSTRLLDLGKVKGQVSAHMFLIEGDLRRPWARSMFTLFPEGAETLAIAKQPGGSVLFGSKSASPDFAEYFSTWEVVEHHHWNPALPLEGDALVECEQEPGLYLVGDHNLCNLEDAYITGVFAATRILAAL